MKKRTKAGFTTIEVAVGGLVLSVIVGGVLASVAQMVSSARTSSTDTELHAMGRRALSRIQDDLQRSGFFIDGTGPTSVRYPHLFQDGDAADEFNVHDHELPNAPLWSVGPNREIVFRVPADADGDGQPDLDANNEASWGAEEISYVVVPGPDGSNYLERRVDGVTSRITARYVDRVVFDDASTAPAGNPVPLHAIRVTIDLGKRDYAGVIHRHTAQTVFRLRNGGIVNL